MYYLQIVDCEGVWYNDFGQLISYNCVVEEKDVEDDVKENEY